MAAKYFITGSIAVLVSWIISGCRLGNHLETAPLPDPISGYYETQPISLSMCSSTRSTTCKNISPSQTPLLVGQVMTNPVGLAVKNIDSGEAYLINSTGGSGVLPIWVKKDNTLHFRGSTPEDTLYQDPACTIQTWIEETGKFTPSSPQTLQNHLVIGKLSLEIQVIQIFGRNCTSTLETLQKCYYDSGACGGKSNAENSSLQQSVQGLFNPYIKAGTMTGSDIATSTSLSYDVIYQ